MTHLSSPPSSPAVPTSSPQSSCQRLRSRGRSPRLSAWGCERESVPNVLLVLHLSHVTRRRRRRREEDRGDRHGRRRRRRRSRRAKGVALGCSSWFLAVPPNERRAAARSAPLFLSNSKRCFLFLPLCLPEVEPIEIVAVE